MRAPCNPDNDVQGIQQSDITLDVNVRTLFENPDFERQLANFFMGPTHDDRSPSADGAVLSPPHINRPRDVD